MATLRMVALYTSSQAPATGLALANILFTLRATNRSTNATTTIVNGLAAIRELGLGMYEYVSTGLDFSTNQYFWSAQYTGAVFTDSAYVYNVEDEEVRSRTTLGAGAITFNYTVLDTLGMPIDDASVWVSTNQAGTNIIASGRSNASGVATFYLDASTYYFFSAKSGYNFSNPDTEIVS